MRYCKNVELFGMLPVFNKVQFLLWFQVKEDNGRQLIIRIWCDPHCNSPWRLCGPAVSPWKNYAIIIWWKTWSIQCKLDIAGFWVLRDWNSNCKTHSHISFLHNLTKFEKQISIPMKHVKKKTVIIFTQFTSCKVWKFS